MIIDDKLIECKHCGSQLCYGNKSGDVTIFICLTCGYTTNSHMTKDSELYKNQMEVMPELYKEISFVDNEGLVWLPNFFKEPGLGMVYMEGTNKDNCKWVGVKEKEIPKGEQHKYPNPHKKGTFYTHKPDMSTKKEFDKNKYIKAYYYVSSRT